MFSKVVGLSVLFSSLVVVDVWDKFEGQMLLEGLMGA